MPKRPHESPSCVCHGCKGYDEYLEALKALWQKGSLSIDFILELFNDPNDTREKILEELKLQSALE